MLAYAAKATGCGATLLIEDGEGRLEPWTRG